MKREWLRLPPETHFEMGAHVGRFSSAVILALIPEYPVFVVSEIPNYHYVGDGEIELSGMTTIEWAEAVVREWHSFTRLTSCRAWVDPETEFAKEVMRSKLRLRKNLNRGPELRTEILREYFLEKKLYFAPWLTILPSEVSKAQWPPEAILGRQARLVGSDYSLNALEQVISRRPRVRSTCSPAPSTFMARMQAERGIKTTKSDSHLGNL